MTFDLAALATLVAGVFGAGIGTGLALAGLAERREERRRQHRHRRWEQTRRAR